MRCASCGGFGILDEINMMTIAPASSAFLCDAMGCSENAVGSLYAYNRNPCRADASLTIAPASSLFLRDAMGCAELSETSSPSGELVEFSEQPIHRRARKRQKQACQRGTALNGCLLQAAE